MKNDRIRFNRNLIPVVLALAWPTMLQELMDTAVQYIDTAMVGSIGTHATAAVGATTTINWLVGSSISAVGIGFLSFIAKAYGAKEKERAAKAAGQAAVKSAGSTAKRPAAGKSARRRAGKKIPVKNEPFRRGRKK